MKRELKDFLNIVWEGRKYLEIQKLGNTSEPNYPGMAQQDIKNLNYSDSKVLEYQASEKVNYNEVLNLRKNEPGYNIIETNKIENVVDDAAVPKLNEPVWNTEAKPIFNGGSKTSYGKSSGSSAYQGSTGSVNDLFGERAYEHLTTVEGFNKKKGGILGGHTRETFNSYSERPVNVISEAKLSNGIYEIKYQVGKLERGNPVVNADGTFEWYPNVYTKTIIDTGELSIEQFENIAKNVFEGREIYPISGNQSYINGISSEGMKIEGWISETTNELESYYPVKDFKHEY